MSEQFKFVANPPRPTTSGHSLNEFINPGECETHFVKSGSTLQVPSTGRNYAVIIMPLLSKPRAFSKVLGNGTRLAEATRLQGKNRTTGEWGAAYINLTDHLGGEVRHGRCLVEAQVNVFVDAADNPIPPAGEGTAATPPVVKPTEGTPTPEDAVLLSLARTGQ